MAGNTQRHGFQGQCPSSSAPQGMLPGPTDSAAQANPHQTLQQSHPGQQSERRPRKPRGPKKAPVVLNGTFPESNQTAFDDGLARVATNGSGTAGPSTATPTSATRGGKVRMQGRNRAFNGQISEVQAAPTQSRGPATTINDIIAGEPNISVVHNGQHVRTGVNHQRNGSKSTIITPEQLLPVAPNARAPHNHVHVNNNPPANRHRNVRNPRKFQSGLSSASPQNTFEDIQERAVLGMGQKQYEGWTGMKDDEDGLVSKLVRGLGGVSGGWLECVICFSNILPVQPIWCCSPTTSTPVPNETSSACCYTPFHLNCIQDWSLRSLNEAKEKARDRDRAIYPEEPVLTWRCPGCQKKRLHTIDRYECFCGRNKNLGSAGAVKGEKNTMVLPHSCGSTCSRNRSYCGHPCPLQCHPGPCPPCQVPLNIPCPSHHVDLVVKCSMARGKDIPVPTCEEPCENLLNCQVHACDRLCHDGKCNKCEEREVVKCYCGKEEKEMNCGWAKDKQAVCGSQGEVWEGRFGCERLCLKPYDCGLHSCQQECHPHALEDLTCPRDPEIVTHCPCGKTPLTEISLPARTSCADPIPTCPLRCGQTRANCDHPCQLTCHEGDCKPCTEMVTLPCRCGSSTVEMVCHQRQDMEKRGEEVLCERVCRALRSCGRHECARSCCPLSYQAKFKGKKREAIMAGDDEGGLHTCSLPCNKVLTCGVHHCPQPDHKGPCPPCLEASYNELACDCGRTVIQPPIRCGTVINCTYPCARPPPECGHPKVTHACHELETCPPCPYLTTKTCACGKNEVKNVRCSQEKVTCGVICNLPLSCGYHQCTKSCHSPGECEEPCRQVCQKPKRLCKHPCTSVCHAPSACPEDEPCAATIDQTCPCGHVRQRTACGACTGNPVSKEAIQLKCVSECAQRQRNARLAEALGIKPSEKLIEYPVELRTFASTNQSFVLTVEKAFSDFFMGPKQATLLPHTPATKRQFILGLAEIYRFGTELVDADPHRTVQIRRRIDSRIPNPLLSSITAAPVAKRQLGGLSDLKKPSFASLASAGPSVAPTPVRGWGVTSASASRTASPQPAHPVRAGGIGMATNLGLHTSKSQPNVASIPIQTLRHHQIAPVPTIQTKDIEENAKEWDEED